MIVLLIEIIEAEMFTDLNISFKKCNGGQNLNKKFEIERAWSSNEWKIFFFFIFGKLVGIEWNYRKSHLFARLQLIE